MFFSNSDQSWHRSCDQSIGFHGFDSDWSKLKIRKPCKKDDWGKPSAQPVNRSSSSGYSSGGGQYAARQGIQGQNINYKGQQIEQGSFTITNDGIKKFDRTFELGAENTFKGDKAAVAGAFTGECIYTFIRVKSRFN